MGTLKRAWLYITRKRGRSVIVFALICAMSVFALLGLTIRRSVSAEADSMRKSLNSSFIIEVDTDLEEYQQYTFYEDGGSSRRYTGPLITQELIDSVLATGHVSGYSCSRNGNLWVGLDLRPGGYADMRDAFIAEPEELEHSPYTMGYIENCMQTAHFYGSSASGLHEFFRTGAFELSARRHIDSGDKNKVIISSYTAELNSLSVGDSFAVKLNGVDASAGWKSVSKPLAGPIELEIVGVFDISFSQEPSAATMEYQYGENQMFCDIATMEALFADPDRPQKGLTFLSAAFFVDDPENLEAAVAQVSALTELSAKPFVLTVDESEYLTSATPLERLKTISTGMLALSAAACFILTALTMNMWAKSRKHEFGILVSLGVGTGQLILQLLLECLIIALAAFLAASAIAALAAEPAGRLAERVVRPGDGGALFSVGSDQYYNLSIEKTAAAPVRLSYALSPGGAMLTAALIGGGALIGAVMAFFNVLYTKPCQLLSS